MADNIYIELELCLDPPITDAAALGAYLNEQIKDWHKAVIANPMLQQRVSKALGFIKGGLSDSALQQQAVEARTQKLKELRRQISLYKKAGAGAVTEKNLKQLKNRFKKFFSEATIQNEADAGTSTAEAALPLFVPPKPPPTLNGDKIVPYIDMKNIAGWLANVKGGRCKNLYQLLELPPSTPTETLYNKAKEYAGIITKMPKGNLEANWLNRLAQKFLLYFKNEAERKSYDLALKREPFDKLCEEELSLYAENFSELEKTDWQIYQEGIADTQKFGFSQEESGWLVYEFYCLKRKCPAPIPEAIPPEPPVDTSLNPFEAILTGLSGVWKNVAGYGTSIIKKVKDYKPPQPDVIEKRETYGPQVQQTVTFGPQSVTEVIKPPVPQPQTQTQQQTPPEFPYRSVQIQTLINNKKFGEIYVLLQPYQYQLPEKYKPVWEAAQTKVAQAVKMKLRIAASIQEGNLQLAERQLAQLEQFLPDYQGLESLRNDIKKKQYAGTELEVEIKNLMDERRFIDAETRLRRFLSEHPETKWYGLLQIVTQIEAEIQKIKNRRNLPFFFGIVFAVLFLVLCFGGIDRLANFIKEHSGEGDSTQQIEAFIYVLQWIPAIVFWTLILAWFVYVWRYLSVLPAMVRRKLCRVRLGRSDFAKAKLSRTVWYAALYREWQQIQQRQQDAPVPKQSGGNASR
jgi:hypothetical protein